MHLHVPFGSTGRAAALSSPFFNTVEQRVDEARQRYFEHGVRPSGLVGDHVIQSWTRCLKSGRRPTEQPVFDPVSRTRASATQERCQALLAAATPEIDQLDAALAGTGCKTVLTDRRGIVVRSGPGTGGGLLEVACRVGVDLGETNFGSTAPGISAHDNALCTVAGAEHFYGVLRQIHCAAAPIHNRAGQVVGVLDLSVEGRPFGFDASSLVRLSALAIENRLLAAPHRDHLVVAFQTRASLLDTPLVALAGVDSDGRLVWANAAAGTLLPLYALGPAGTVPNRNGRPSAPDARELLGLDVNALLRLAHDGRDGCRAIVLPQGLMVWMRVTAPQPASAASAASAASIERRTALAAASAAAASESGRAPSAPSSASARAAEPATVSRDAAGLLAAEHPAQAQLPTTTADELAPAAAMPASLVIDADLPTARGSLDAANRALIEAALRRHKGNVSKAARELGVSRGLLYRRLHAWSGEPADRAAADPAISS